MNDEMNKHKSPFAKYDDGTKTRKPLTYAPSEDFKKTFLKFIDNRFNSISSAIDFMVKDYIFKYAFESKGYYEKTIVCVLSKGEIHHALEDDAYEPVDYERFKEFPLRIHKVGILNRHAKSKFDDEVVDNEMVENYELIAALVHDKSYGDVDLITKDFVYNNYAHFFHSLEEDAIVLEIALNNNWMQILMMFIVLKMMMELLMKISMLVLILLILVLLNFMWMHFQSFIIGV